jgi:hypothetical protein
MSEFGTGIRLGSDFDLEAPNGRLQTVSGQAVIERDLAFALAREADIRRGEVPDADFRAELELLVRRILTRDPRIAAVDSLAIDLDVAGAAKTAAVELSVQTVAGENAALILNL